MKQAVARPSGGRTGLPRLSSPLRLGHRRAGTITNGSPASKPPTRREACSVTPRFSARTLGEFEDASSGLLVLRDIDRVFVDSDIPRGSNPREGGGQRRMLFRDYIASVNQNDARDVGRLAEALGWILEIAERAHPDTFEKLRCAAQRDGFAYAEGRLRPTRAAVAPFVAVNVDDLRAIGDQAVRLHLLANERPTDAIGGAKELVESVCKTVLRLTGEPVPRKGADLVEVARATMKALELVPAGVDEAKKGRRGRAQVPSATRCVGSIARRTAKSVRLWARAGR